MSEQFHVRFATPADAFTIGWHRARMFQDMGDVPANLFSAFCAKSQERLRVSLTSGEYVGWLASPKDALNTIVGGAGVHLRQVLPHPLETPRGIAIAEGRHGIIQNVFTEPDWRRRGVATLLVRQIIDWAQEQHLDNLVLHSSEAGRELYERLGFVATNEMRLAGSISETDR